MKSTKRTDSHIVFLILALALALCFRLIRLSQLPLSDMEASLAMQALSASRNLAVTFGAFPAYVGLTSVIFGIFSPSDFLARLVPALVGAALVFAPFLFRRQIGWWPATGLALVFAISPEMVGLSRMIGSPMMAMVLLALSVGLFLNKKPIGAGVGLALGLMSGPGFLVGVVILSLSYLIARWLFLRPTPEDDSPQLRKLGGWGQAAIAAGVTLLTVGTGFFLTPANLSGTFSGLVEFIAGFGRTRSLSPGLIPLALIAYVAPAVLLGIWGSIRAIVMRSKLDLFLMVWWVVGLSFILLYPAGSASDLIWVTLPLWVLSIRVLVFAWHIPDSSRNVMVVTGIMVVVVFAFLLLAFRSMIGASLEQSQLITFLLAMSGGIVLLVAVVLLVSFGWSQEVALPGLLLGLATVFTLGCFALSVRSTGLSSQPSEELWYPEQHLVSTTWLRTTLDQVIHWNAGGGTAVDISVADFDTSAIRWFLREDEPVAFVPYLPPQSQPGMVITSDQAILEISNSYRGQDLVWSRDVLWHEMDGRQFLRWLVTRDAPTQSNEIIIWVRTDLMPDHQFSQ